MSFDDLLMELKGQKNVQEDPGNVPLEKLFHDAFMTKHSNVSSFAEFMEKGNFQADTLREISNIQDELFDRHVARETKFSNWQAMLDTAKKEHSDTLS
ncbi:hypothetical protein HUB94_06515 [Paenibacillus cellulosilyticus]|nr:hypothetical protein [Paenibacillus cellulosilyticus]QKS46414.1 hypothetical protein HUB94_06515 [Paenibacillus cellulosilyticus]